MKFVTITVSFYFWKIVFDSETARLAWQKSKLGPAKVNQDLRHAFETICQLSIMKLYERMDELNPSQVLKLV